jgi:hypothetical protein
MYRGGSGNPAILGAAHAQGPEALRPRLAAGLPFSDGEIVRLWFFGGNDLTVNLGARSRNTGHRDQ